MAVQRVVLASQSPRRKQLLEWAEVPFDIIVRSTDESYPPGLATPLIPVHIARQKALAVQDCEEYKRYNAGTTIVAADTVVVLEDVILGKPKDREDAIDILSMLSDRKHLVITGVVILHAGEEIAFSDTTEVWFHPITTAEIAFYVDKYQPFDKAGAYAIQEWIGVTGIKRINGDFYNVMGLPVSRVVQYLQALG
ncbi:septum formation protein Maf [Pseudoflavitalea sp. X16]|uniref:Maf family nucleotide pyrophosphatase n=1 Tax=Paraflavitalea devenefica TaxID=2716334 RepID=UPI00141F6806|nr:Maf family protein [Paraflavitalea devenefica]NII28979.1 septum formation protein Maf [Paraflavitalea devenefica]